MGSELGDDRRMPTFGQSQPQSRMKPSMNLGMMSAMSKAGSAINSQFGTGLANFNPSLSQARGGGAGGMGLASGNSFGGRGGEITGFGQDKDLRTSQFGGTASGLGGGGGGWGASNMSVGGGEVPS